MSELHSRGLPVVIIHFRDSSHFKDLTEEMINSVPTPVVYRRISMQEETRIYRNPIEQIVSVLITGDFIARLEPNTFRRN